MINLSIFSPPYWFGKAFKGYDECSKVFGAMENFRCRKGKKVGGIPPFCMIRKSAQKKKLRAVGCVMNLKLVTTWIS